MKIMYGKIYESLFEGSMYGKGALVFAVWAYVIAKMRPDKEVGAQVHLNPDAIAGALGEDAPEVQKVIDWLCQPDPRSNNPSEEGRRLIKIGTFAYRVVNGAHYMNMRSEEEHREYNRLAKQRERAVKRGNPLVGEARYVAAVKNGGAGDVREIEAQEGRRSDRVIAKQRKARAEADKLAGAANGPPPTDAEGEAYGGIGHATTPADTI